MALFAMALPIPAGKMDQWRRFSGELNGPRKADFKASRDRAGVHERVFLQQTPHGDMVIVTMEGENPEQGMAKFAQGTDPFTEWFVAEAKDIHGVDLRNPPPGGMPKLVADSHGESHG